VRRYSELTVNRLRPLARRRFSTRRPFLVLMRTRNPCARLRRRVLGWNVRFPFMISAGPFDESEPLIVANALEECQRANELC